MKISKKDAAHYIWGNQCDGWRLVQNEGLSVIHERMPAHTSEVKHYHEKARQFFFVLSGTATMDIGGKEIQLNEQEGIEVAPLIPHRLLNQSDRDVEFLVISAPNSRGDRIAAEG
ncbi:cupin domain-containing protein [Paenibacillus kobensis]|uniref:cupin domain-containing protein n=1 Tax=Paenibacillus kobensis TaxID=59841 RepID=UPI000FDBC09A|nr:cupin domain-containing protein [Paenibacillus kobensis]